MAALGLAVGLFIVVCGALFLLQDRMIFPAPAGPEPWAEGASELARIETSDGENLVALWHPPEPGEATILFLHGNGTAIAMMTPVIDELAAAGFGVLMPAWRGYPGSSGKPSEAGLLLDAEAAYSFVEKRTDGPIALYGQSLGSGVAVHLAGVREVAAVVLEAPYDSVLAVARARTPFVPVGALLRHSFRSDERIGKVTAPILIHHGTDDAVIPITHGRALHAAAKGSRLNEVEGATHFNIGALTLSDTIAFLREVLPSESAPAVPPADQTG